MARTCRPDPNTNERLAEAQAAERCLTPCWPLRQSALWRVKNGVFAWSRTRGQSGGDALSALPLRIRQELLDAMLRLKPDGREVIQAVRHLVRGGILSFDLGCLDDCHHYDVKRIIGLLTDSGHILRSVAVRGQWLFDTNNHAMLSDLLRSLVTAERICLQETTPGAPELDVVLRTSRGLRSLEISQPSLCDSEVSAFADRCCVELNYLKVPSSVRGPGLLTLLRVFPNLRMLECCHLDELLDSMDACEDQHWWKERALGLTSVRTSHPIGRSTLVRLVAWCPNLDSVSVEIQEDVDLSPLTTVRNLKSLELRNSAILPVSYENKVSALVEEVGPCLVHLCLEHFDNIDLTKLADSCRKLESLELRWFTTLGVSRIPRGLKPFASLRSLCVRPRTNQNVRREACEILVTCCQQLEKLELYCCYGLDDSLLTKVLKTNSLDKLRTLLLRHGHGVTGTGLRNLVGRSTKIETWDFGAFTPAK